MLLDNLEFMNWVGNLYLIVIYIFHCAFLTDLGYPRSKNPTHCGEKGRYSDREGEELFKCGHPQSHLRV